MHYSQTGSSHRDDDFINTIIIQVDAYKIGYESMRVPLGKIVDFVAVPFDIFKIIAPRTDAFLVKIKSGAFVGLSR